MVILNILLVINIINGQISDNKILLEFHPNDICTDAPNNFININSSITTSVVPLQDKFNRHL